MDARPRVSTFVSSLVNYTNTIPAATDPDVKPPAPSARMGKQNSIRCHLFVFVMNACGFNLDSLDIHVFVWFHSSSPENRNTDWCIFAMHPEHFRCYFIHSFDLGGGYGRCYLWFSYCAHLLLCGKWKLHNRIKNCWAHQIGFQKMKQNLIIILPIHFLIDNAHGHLNVCNRNEWCGSGRRELFHDIKVKFDC